MTLSQQIDQATESGNGYTLKEIRQLTGISVAYPVLWAVLRTLGFEQFKDQGVVWWVKP